MSAWLLSVFNVFPMTLEATHTDSSGSNTVTMSVYSAHWPLWLRIAFIGTTGIGVLLLLLPKREKMNT